MPDEPEALGLLSLMLLQDSRGDARVDDEGELVLLEDQDRSLWDRREIETGLGVLERATRLGPPAPTSSRPRSRQSTLARRPRPRRLVADRLPLRAAGARAALAGVIGLNRAAAVAMAEGPERGLELMDDRELSEPWRATSHSGRPGRICCGEPAGRRRR
jgi:RNA polymerase sigma-70 factor (ECF subfamily)